MSRQGWADIGLVALAALTVLMVVLALTQGGRQADPALSAVAASASVTPVATPGGVTRQPIPPGVPRAVFLGDSATAGIGAEGGKAWTTLVAEAQGWGEINLAHGGTGYVTSVTGPAAQQACGEQSCPSYLQLADQVGAADPDVIVVSGGREDGERSVSRAAGDLFLALEQLVPDARIIVVSPLWDESPLSPDMAGTVTGVRVAAQQTGVRHLDIGQPLDGRADLVAADGVNPNAAGHRAVADAVLAELD